MSDWNQMTQRERDALVAEKVMGWPEYSPGHEGACWFPPPTPGAAKAGTTRKDAVGSWSPTTDIRAAWDVVEGADTVAIQRYYDPEVRPADAPFYWVAMVTYHDPEGFGEAKAETAPEAICLAALRAREPESKP